MEEFGQGLRRVLAIVFVAVLVLATWVVASYLTFSGRSADIYAIGTTSRATGTLYLGGMEDRDAVYGYVICDPIVDADANADVGALLADTVIMVLKSGHNNLRYTLDSVRRVAAATTPCTLVVNNTIDSLFLSSLELDYVVSDTDNFAASDSIKTGIRWDLRMKKR